MSAPVSDLSSSSISSSGHVDGLGQRSLAFDRETGAMLERLYVRPELAVFEQMLGVESSSCQPSRRNGSRGRRGSSATRPPASSSSWPSSSPAAGCRSCSMSRRTAAVPGVDVALGYLLEVFAALTALHTIGRGTHGLIDASRTIVTAEGQVVFLDAAFGPAVERSTAHHSGCGRSVRQYPAAGNERLLFDALPRRHAGRARRAHARARTQPAARRVP